MAVYIKANKKVAQYLGLTTERNQLSDGNYLLWQADMLRFGPLWKLGEILAQIGGLSLTHTEAREEQDGVKLRSLPEATDVRFKTESATVTADNYTDNAGDTQAANDAAQTESTQPTSGEGTDNNEETDGDPGNTDETIGTDEADGGTDDADSTIGTDETRGTDSTDEVDSNIETRSTDEADSTNTESGPDNAGPTTAGSGEDAEVSDEADTDNEENDVTKEESHG